MWPARCGINYPRIVWFIIAIHGSRPIDMIGIGRPPSRKVRSISLWLLPSHGVLVLEVKGGQIQYEAENRGWYRIVSKDDIRPIQDPLEQARRNTHYLIDQIKQSGYPGKQDPPFAYGYAAVFPDCNYTGPAPPGAEPIILFRRTTYPTSIVESETPYGAGRERQNPIGYNKRIRQPFKRPSHPPSNSCRFSVDRSMRKRKSWFG
ncbi:MAG: nuclease-related domain-containing protein [Gammaproteobacteria bacterium]|nr:nuclease-related domain-containing protein [Gammaproteobacteria bacterium]